MGRLDRKTLGDVKGKLGNAVFRTVNGKTFISIRPDSYKTGKSKEAKKNRSKFQTAAKFAQVVNKDPDLSACWKQAKLKGHLPYNRLIKYNIKQVTESTPSLLNIITPNSTLNVETEIVVNSDKDFLVSLNMPDQENFSDGKAIFFLLAGYSPEEEPSSNEFIYKLYKKELNEFPSSGKIEFIMELSQFDKDRLSIVNEFLIWSAVVSKKGDKYYWSETYSDKIKT